MRHWHSGPFARSLLSRIPLYLSEYSEFRQYAIMSGLVNRPSIACKENHDYSGCTIPPDLNASFAELLTDEYRSLAAPAVDSVKRFPGRKLPLLGGRARD